MKKLDSLIVHHLTLLSSHDPLYESVTDQLDGKHERPVLTYDSWFLGIHAKLYYFFLLQSGADGVACCSALGLKWKRADDGD